MEVDGAHYRKQLLQILKHIANASFVSFDLEMSGISTKSNSKSSTDRTQDVGKPTLQALYEDMKKGAERYQVLQFGITCVEEDRSREYYLARPYNFNVSPFAADGVDLKQDRIFTFSSSACDFLNKNNFDFGKVFTSGVPYLSREEEEELREEYSQRANKTAKIPDVVFPPDDSSTLEFYRKARRTIQAWMKKDDKDKEEYINIGPHPPGALNGFQRRLIHQLVRNEFPTLRTFARNEGSFMQIEKLDVKKEAEFQARKLKYFNYQLAKQKGLRWIFEALVVGGDLSGIDPEWFWDKNSENASLKDLAAITKEVDQIKYCLRQKTHVIVGHNLFMDLGYLYNTFVGPLPCNVKHFQEDIHELFPIVIDTKYLATHGDDSMGQRKNLKELLDPFTKVHLPLIVLHEKHNKYGAAFGKEHEAGYDSWMTAELFVKLSSKLHALNKHLTPLSYASENDTPTLSPLFKPTSSRSRFPPNKFSALEEDTITFSDSDSDDLHSSSTQTSGGVRISPPSTSISPRATSTSPPPAEYYAHKFYTSNLNKATKASYSAAASAGGMNGLSARLGGLDGNGNGVGNGGEEKKLKLRQWIPSMRNPFWDTYANKLRVHAADGGVCDLEETSDDVEEGEGEYEDDE